MAKGVRGKHLRAAGRAPLRSLGRIGEQPCDARVQLLGRAVRDDGVAEPLLQLRQVVAEELACHCFQGDGL